VIVVNEAFARRYFPGESPLGKRIDFSWGTQGMQEIIGVVRDMREGAIDSPAEPTMYVPLEQRPADAMFLLLRTSIDPASVIDGVRRAMLEIDPDLPLARIRTLDDIVASSMANRRVPMSMLGVFSIVALLLAGVGLYATISYSVIQRQREIGIRVALGAESGQVVRNVLRNAFVLIAIGVAVGSILALWLNRFLAGLLYGVEARDPATFIGVALLVSLVALVASYLPALWASRIDPMVILRSE
jgi:predicted permease